MPASRVPGPVGSSHEDDAAWLPLASLRFAAPGMVGDSGMHGRSSGSVQVTGDFTMLKYLLNRSAAQLERHIGFSPGRLSCGFQIVALARGEALRPRDFELGASTRWSQGEITSGGEGELAAGTLVADSISMLLDDRGQDVDALKATVAAFFRKEMGNTPAKVLPRWRHQPGMQYPDATALDDLKRSGIPQFKLITPRTFVPVFTSGWQK